MKIIGIDEVGRGPLAGPVTLCAVSCEEITYRSLLKNKNLPPLGKDSKKLKEKDRKVYDKFLRELSEDGKIKFKIVHISNKIIDKSGISFSIKKAMADCINSLQVENGSKFLLDGGLKVSSEFKNQKTIIKGDEKERIIAWASILAKVSRDSLMIKTSKKYSEYGFDVHKGYGTKKHRDTIKKYGITDFHRSTFCKKINI